MIVVKLFGGLGNQMFQYATAKNLAIQHNTKLYLDISWYSNIRKGTKRNFDLYNYSISGELPSKSLKRKLIIYNNRFLKYLPFPRKLRAFSEISFSYDPVLTTLKNDIYLNGYWQSYLYFNDSRKTLLDEFIPNKKLSINEDLQRKIISDSSSVAVHIRRTDYLSNPHHPVCEIEYYLKAEKIILESLKNPTFYIFSDDPDYVQQNIKFKNKTVNIVQGKDTFSSVEDLCLMSMCSNQIIANSSFSWWGAWLNINPNKIVIAPSRWFADEKIDTKHLCPTEWIKL